MAASEISIASAAPKFSWTNPLFLITIASIFGAFVGFGLSAYNGSNLGLTIFSNLATLLASSLISYIITSQSERKQFSEDLAKFADFSRRRLKLLSINLRSLTLEIANIETNDETKRLVAYIAISRPLGEAPEIAMAKG